MVFFDTHCHLDFPIFDSCRDEILRSCQQSGVERVVLPAVGKRNWQTVLELSQQYLPLSPALGMHPYFMDEHVLTDLDLMQSLLEKNAVVALGEIGLDFWDQDADRKAQITLFEAQLAMADKLGLPVILHSRKSNDQVLSRLKKQQIHSGVVHAFSGSWQQAKGFVDQGLKIGLGGALTYERANKLRAVVRQLPIEAMVLETDAPDMPISGRQGQVNRPDYLPEVFQVLVMLRDEEPDLLARQLWQNSIRLFGMSDSAASAAP